MARKLLAMLGKNLKSGVGRHHTGRHCHINTSEKKLKHAGTTIPCDVVNGLVEISSTGKCSRVDCAHAQ